MSDEENKRAIPKYSYWYEFLKTTLEIDKNREKPRGWHWFCAFRDLSGSDLEQIQQKLPEQHPFKSKTPTQSFLVPELTDAILWLKSSLKITDNIEKIDFSGLKFVTVDFSSLVFPINVSFEKTEFLDGINFNEALFLELANFNEVKFFKTASFNNVIFFENAQFSFTEFSCSTEFNKAKFHKVAVFIKAKFTMDTTFNAAEFFNAVSFVSAIFVFKINFEKTIFYNFADFIGVTFTGAAIFSDVQFKNVAPQFYSAKITANITWERNTDFWPELEKHTTGETNENYKERLESNQSTYENLASSMQELDKYHDQHFFYRQETRCRRRLEKNHFTYCSYWLYEKFADYGYGVESAVAAWFWHMVLGAHIIAIMAFSNAWWAGWKDGYWEAIKSVACSIPVSFSNAHRFLFFKDGAFNGCYGYFTGNLFFNIIWGFQTVIGIILLFLLLLTLRIRFRLK